MLVLRLQRRSRQQIPHRRHLATMQTVFIYFQQMLRQLFNRSGYLWSECGVFKYAWRVYKGFNSVWVAESCNGGATMGKNIANSTRWQQGLCVTVLAYFWMKGHVLRDPAPVHRVLMEQTLQTRFAMFPKSWSSRNLGWTGCVTQRLHVWSISSERKGLAAEITVYS